MTLLKIELLTALNLPKVGRKTILRLLSEQLGSLEDQDGSDGISILDLISKKMLLNDNTIEDARCKAVQQLEEADSLGLSVLTVLDSDYPPRLRTIEDKPIVLFVRGSIESLSKERAVAIIGTREPSSFAQKSARSSARVAAELGTVVVSGLAKGCDTLAHCGCLDRGGVTVAVMAHGLDKVYPYENRQLACQIVEEGGALVSEYPVGTPAHRSSFVERDRLQSGLSDGVLVIETSETGGTMHTVRFAVNHGRQLATICHPSRYEVDERVGGNRLVRTQFNGSSVCDRPSLEDFLSFSCARTNTCSNGAHDSKELRESGVNDSVSEKYMQGSLFEDDYAE